MSDRVTIKQVAQQAGVSAATVSAVIRGATNGNVRISAPTRERVERVVSELGYSPNFLARGLRNQKSQLLGFITDVVGQSLATGAMLQGAQDAASRPASRCYCSRPATTARSSGGPSTSCTAIASTG
jgi:LacI family transcriptional regulator